MEPITVVFLSSLAGAVLGQVFVSWMGNLTGHYFATRAPEEWELDNTLGPLPDGSFRCHKLAGTGVVPRWVTSVQLVGFLLRIAGGIVFIVAGAIIVIRWIRGS